MKMLLFVYLSVASFSLGGDLRIEAESSDPVQQYAAQRLREAFAASEGYPDAEINFAIDGRMAPQPYRTEVEPDGNAIEVKVVAGDNRGLLYGSMTVLEQLSIGGGSVENAEETARFQFRALKFNLPWVSYRAGRLLRRASRTPAMASPNILGSHLIYSIQSRADLVGVEEWTTETEMAAATVVSGGELDTKVNALPADRAPLFLRLAVEVSP